MLRVYIPGTEFFDPQTETFITIEGQYLSLEHSLVSISKWESKWKKDFLSDEPKTKAQSIDYIRCMTLTQNVNPLLYKAIPNSVMKEIQDYIDDPMTATTFFDKDDLLGEKKSKKKLKKRRITSELIYYWMVALNIPFECQKWHFNRLMTLIRICGEKNNPNSKMSTAEIMKQNKALNAMRKAKHHTKG